MARLYSNGFELQNKVLEQTTKSSNTNISISTSVNHGGLASAQITSADTTGGLMQQKYLSSVTTGNLYFRMYFYIGTLPSSITSLGGNSDVTIAGFLDNSNSSWAELTIDASGVIRVYQDGSSRSVVGTSSALSTGVWHCLEFAYGSANSYVEARVDGVSIGSTSSASGLVGVNQIGWGLACFYPSEKANATLYCDDIAVNDTSGSFQNSWPGVGNITTLRPASAGDSTQWTPLSGTNFSQVKEITPDDATSYVSDALTANTDLYKVAGVSATNLTSGSATSTSSATTSSISPGANKLILLTTSIRNGSSTNPTAPTVAGNGLTWVQIGTANYDSTSSSRRAMYLFRAMSSTTPTPGTVVITYGETETDVDWIIDQVSNVDTTGTNGSGAIVQVSTPTTDEAGSNTSITTTLGAFSSANNATYGTFGTDGATGVTAGSGFTLVGHANSSTNVTADTEFKTGNDTTVDMSWGIGALMGAIAVELKSAPSSAAGIPSGSTINVVSVGGKFRNPTADATTNFKFEIEKTASGTLAQSASITPNTTTWSLNATAPPNAYPITLYQDPDSSAWTTSTLDTMQIGAVTGTIGVFGIQLSTIWALVEWAPAAVNASVTQVAATLTATTGTQVVGIHTPPVGAGGLFGGAYFGQPYFADGAGSVTTIVNASVTQVAATLTATGGTQTVATVNNSTVAQVAATLTATTGTQAIVTTQSSSITQVAATITATTGTQVIQTNGTVAQSAATLTATGGTQVVATVNNVSIAQVGATLTATGGLQSVGSQIDILINQVAATLTATGGTQSVATVNNAAITQVAATLTVTGGTQAVATVNNATVAQVAATLTVTGGAQTVTTFQQAAVTQVAATLTATTGTQVVQTNGIVAQSAATLTVTGGTQAVATVQNATVAQLAATLTLTGGTQVVASVNDVSVSQSAATLTATGGTQAVSSKVSTAVTQVGATLTVTTGTQAVSAASGTTSASITQVAATLTVQGGTQIVSVNTSPLPKPPTLIFLTDGRIALRLSATLYLPL